MTDASAITPDRLASPPRVSARWRFRILLALAGSYLFITFSAPFLTSETGLLLLKPRDWWIGVDHYWLYGCVILVAGWAALSPGRIALRVPQSVVAICWLLLAWLLGETISLEWPWLEQTILVCLTVAATTFVVLIYVRRLTGKKLVVIDEQCDQGNRPFQYSLTTLLLAMLLVGVTITLLGWIHPLLWKNAAQSPLWYHSGARKEMAWETWNGTIGPLLIAAACLPAFLSARKRSLAWALGLSTCVLIVQEIRDDYVRGDILLPLLFGKSTYRWGVHAQFIHSHVAQHALSVATLTLCLLTAAAAMHHLGYRLAAVATKKEMEGTTP